jgi:uridine kinase
MPHAVLFDPQAFSSALYGQMARIYPGVAELELYEFRYCLETVSPPEGWEAVELEPAASIESRLQDRQFYFSIQLKPQKDGRATLDEQILRLLRMLFVGLVSLEYPPEWVERLFYFDVRGFLFFPRIRYYTAGVLDHLGGRPCRQFEPKQKQFDRVHSLGYKAFREANREVDSFFIQTVLELVRRKGTPILVAIAGATAAGKTEIVARLREAFAAESMKTAAVELDNFFTDRDQREARGIGSLGKEALHYELLSQCLGDIRAGRRILTPRYNFIDGTSSHDLSGRLKPGRVPVEIEPADIIFIEGNFPFLLPEVAPLVGIKVVYLTDDEIRLKRKWRRDMDFRRKYELVYFLNRYFREQFLMAEAAYIPQMEVCDLVVDTTAAAVWMTPDIARVLS